MNRLRVRVELNRRKSGVPMHELVSVVEETHKFFQLLAEDVHIEGNRGEWHASNFDPESLNFTAEFDGPASAQQIRDFGSAFGGATSLRRDTIAQFTRIADFIGDDELVGFGLYQTDEESEPSEWRCLSRRDAMRFAGEIQLLAKAAGASELDAPLPAVMNGSVGGRRLFKDSRERAAVASDPAKWIREVESSLTRRIAVLEDAVETQARQMQALENSSSPDEKFQRMLGAMESFWTHAPQQLALGAAESIAPRFTAAGDNSPRLPGDSIKSTVPAAQPRKVRWLPWGLGLALAAVGLAVAATRSWDIEAQLWKFLAVRHRAQIESVVLVPPLPYISTAEVRTAFPDPLALARSTSSAVAVHPSSPGPAESETAAMRRDATPGVVNEIALDIPPELRAMVGSEVLVNVSVGIDGAGNVITADVASMQGVGADALAHEALKAARGFRFRPARRGKRNVSSQTVLTFTFKPDSKAWITESLPRGN